MRLYVELSEKLDHNFPEEIVHWCVLSTWHSALHVVCVQ